MSDAYSLRRRLLFVMIGAFLLGLACSVAFEYLESIDIALESVYGDAIELLIMAVPFLIACLLIWSTVRWTLREVARASYQAERIGPANPAARISDAGLPLEIQPLVRAINGALERLAVAYEAERRLTADAAHELRTPLAVLSLRMQRARIENTLDWDAIERDLANMTRVVSQLLDLARKDARTRSEQDRERARVNLARLAREAAATMLPLIEQAGRSLDVDAPEQLVVCGSHDDLGDMLRNLLDNALVHGSGRISMRVARGAAPAEPSVIIDVADEGPGVAEEDRASLFGRFRKGRQSSAGVGLGLAIVQEVALAHGGEARFLPGVACVVRVTLPMAA
jgi:signal transduction histidine kinase